MNDYEELYKWVEEHPITRPKRNINRDFSDALPLVQILKYHFPKLVQEHNYSPKNSYAQKVINWEMLNNRVLKKLKMNISGQKIELLAKGEPGVIEAVLESIRIRIEKIKSEENPDDFNNLLSKPDKKSSSPKKIMSSENCEKLEAEIAEKNKAIVELKAKVNHLEDLLNVKEERIKDLTKQVVSMQGDSASIDNAASKSRFFNIF